MEPADRRPGKWGSLISCALDTPYFYHFILNVILNVIGLSYYVQHLFSYFYHRCYSCYLAVVGSYAKIRMNNEGSNKKVHLRLCKSIPKGNLFGINNVFQLELSSESWGIDINVLIFVFVISLTEIWVKIYHMRCFSVCG